MATMMAKFRDTEATTCSISHKKRKFRGKREARRKIGFKHVSQECLF